MHNFPYNECIDIIKDTSSTLLTSIVIIIFYMKKSKCEIFLNVSDSLTMNKPYIK